MRAASGRFGLNLGRSNKDNSDKDGEPAQSGHGRVASGGGGANGGGLGAGELAKSVKGKIAHTTILPSLMGNQNLRELQDLITNEKSVIQNEERLGNSISQAGQSLALWGAAQGSDLSDVLAHANTILQHLAQALQTYAARSGDIRILLKNIRSREETLEDLLKRRRQTGSRAEREEKKLAKMGQENKNLQAQTELLQSLRDQMRQMDTDILIEEAKLGDYKRQATKEALAIKFGGCFELAEKAQIVGELGKLLIEEIPLEETPPGYGRAPYEGFEQTQRLSTEAERVINDVVYHPPVVKPLPPGLPHSRRLEPLQSPSATNLEGSVADDYRRAAAQYGDDPHHHAVEHQTSFVDAPQQARSLAGDSQYQGPATPDIRNTAGEGHFGHGHVMFAAPESPGYVRAQPSHDAYALAPPLPATNAVGGFGHVEEHGYEYEQAREAAALEKERLQAEANTRENDDVYAADATIMPAKHVFPVHAVPEVTNLNEAPASRSVDTQFPASNPTSAAQYSREQPPPHNLVERGSTRTLTVGDWTIRTVKRPILNGKEIDAAAEHLDIPLPEMTFGNNSLDLTYAPDQTSAPLSLNFSALQALADVATGEGWEERNGGGVQVSMAEHWSQNRTQGTSYLSDIPISDKPTKPFDWTYSTTFSGALQSGNFDGFTTSETDSIPMDLLARQDPVLDKIIFYDDVSLFEDELHDNGESVMNVRIRVMPHSFFILSRLFLRVDNVLFRTHDVRIFHAFGSDKIIREIMGRECAYNDMKARLETQDDLSPLNDANFVTQVLSSMPLAPSSSSGKPWPGLGVKRDVLLLDQSRASRSQPQQQTDGDHQTQYQSSALPSIPATSPRADNEGGFATHHQLTTSELQAQTKTSIMDRPRGIRRGGDPAGDGTAGGFNYGYDNSAYFVRNHASSPSNLPRQEEILPESPGLQTETPGFAGDRDAFYTPIGTPDLPRPTTAFHPGTGQRTISASAFRRNKSSLNQSIDGAPVAPYTDAARETASIPATKTGIDEIYQDSAPRPQHGRSTEPEHDNGNLEAQLDHTAARESIPPTYHESFSHSPTFEAGREDESANKDLR